MAPTIEPATTDDVDAIVEQWVDLARGQREYGAYVLPGENRTEIREEFLRGAVTGGLLVAREDPDSVGGEGDGDGDGDPDEGDDGDVPPGTAAGIAGFVSFSLSGGRFAESTTRGRVSNLYVRPDRRSEGIGGELLSAAERRLHEDGAAVVSLEAMAANRDARRFYRDRGYTRHRIELSKDLDGEG
jgi:ribosomal protein S18 acetylase RimI-like enzyme